jgi:hypothetical protein
MKFYETGKTKEDERAYSYLLLFKFLLLQKWYQIKSDPELESQINDRIFFKSFLSLPMDYIPPIIKMSSCLTIHFLLVMFDNRIFQGSPETYRQHQ